MKIRIKGNSIRLRLTKTDVQSLKNKGIVQEQTIVGEEAIFKYSLNRNAHANTITADFRNNEIYITLPTNEANIITDTDKIGVQGYQQNGQEGDLFLLIEKDLKCIDDTMEDQSDMYENPKSEC